VDRKKETRPFEDVRGELESQLRQNKQGTAVQDYIDRLKQDAGFEAHEL